MNNFIYFLSEVEFRYIIKNFNDTKKIEMFKNIIKKYILIALLNLVQN